MINIGEEGGRLSRRGQVPELEVKSKYDHYIFVSYGKLLINVEDTLARPRNVIYACMKSTYLLIIGI